MLRSFIGILILATAAAVVPEYFLLGFTHVLPGGADHILFILALFFLTRDFATLLFQMTLFTLAHSLTLGLSLFGLVDAPSAAVETGIALSIVWVGVENLYQKNLSRWRPWAVFGFGLLHGLGFAHSFGENRMPPGDFLPALFSFNAGIECGQLAVIGLAYAVVAFWWRHARYQAWVARPASLAIAAVGLFWAADRGF
jgi:HupE / UreJ protein